MDHRTHIDIHVPQLGLSSAPTVYHLPATTGPNASKAKSGSIQYDLNRM